MNTAHRKGQRPAPCASHGRQATSATLGHGTAPLAQATRRTAWVVGLATAAAMTGCGSTDRGERVAAQAPTGDQVGASADLDDAHGRKVATVVFNDLDGKTWVTVELAGDSSIAAGFHGFHIHANDLSDGGTGCLADKAQPSATWFVSADGHFATEGQSHAAHAGDMPSVQVQDDGTAYLEFTTRRVSLSQIIGRAVVLHAGPDNFGNVPLGTAPDQYTANATHATTKSTKTGNAGDRIACGLITAS